MDYFISNLLIDILFDYLILRARFGKDGLYVFGSLYADWDKITEAKLVGSLGRKYIKIKLSQRKSPFFKKGWSVPTYLNNPDNTVLKYAPKDHPVRKLLEQTSQQL